MTTAISGAAQENVRQQLRRVLSSKSFRQVTRLQKFLGFIVEETLSGRGDKLKEFPIGVEAFDKDPSFDPRMDPLVRVQARRLRSRLDRYYREEGQKDEILIELPKGGYEPIFQERERTTKSRTILSVLTRQNTILVRQYEDDSSDHDLGYFCNGLRHEIIRSLLELAGIRVLTITECDRAPSDFRGKANGPLILGGSVRKSRHCLRIMSHLIDSQTNYYLWSEFVDADEEDVLSAHEEVSRRIVERLRAELSGAGTSMLSRKTTESVNAYNLYRRGRFHLEQRTEQGLMKALECFDKCIKEEPHYAAAYSGLADAHCLLAHYGVLAPAAICTKAASNAAWSVLLDEGSAEGHTSVAHVKATQDWDWRGAEQEFLHALCLDPRYATAHHWYAMSCLVPMTRLDEALDQLEQAQALDPVSSIISRDLAIVHYYRRDLEMALEQCDHTIEQNPHFAAAYWTLGLVQDEREDFDEAIAAFQRAIQLSPVSPRIQGSLARTFVRAGELALAHRILGELIERSKHRYISPFELASIYFALERRGQGFRWLTRAFVDRCFELLAIKVDPKFKSVSDDPRFVKLSDKLEIA